MKYKRAFFLAFIVTIIGFIIYWNYTNQIHAELNANRIPDLELFQYQFWGEMILFLGIGLFGLFIAIGLRNWIGL